MVTSPQSQLIKAGLIVAGGIGAFLVGKKIIKKLSKPPGRDLVNATTSDADKILKNNLTLPPGLQTLPSYSPSQMKSFADVIHRAMKGPGTDEKAISDNFGKMNNDLDIMLLIEAFGVRDEDNLSQWLEDDGIVEDVNKVLATKSKITYRF